MENNINILETDKKGDSKNCKKDWLYLYSIHYKEYPDTLLNTTHISTNNPIFLEYINNIKMIIIDQEPTVFNIWFIILSFY